MCSHVDHFYWVCPSDGPVLLIFTCHHTVAYLDAVRVHRLVKHMLERKGRTVES